MPSQAAQIFIAANINWCIEYIGLHLDSLHAWSIELLNHDGFDVTPLRSRLRMQ